MELASELRASRWGQPGTPDSLGKVCCLPEMVQNASATLQVQSGIL